MRALFIIFLTLFACNISWGQYEERNILQNDIKEKDIIELYNRIPDYKKYKKEFVNAVVEKLPSSIKDSIISLAEKNLTYQWPQLYATNYAEFSKNGNRSRYHGMASKRRSMVSLFAQAELYEGKGRFLEQLINGVWLLCEQTTWCNPADNSKLCKEYGLQYPYEKTVDLRVAETSGLLSWIMLMFEDEFDNYSKSIVPRIKYEINTRFIEPNIYQEFNRMGLDKGPTNNWNVLINKQWIISMIFNDLSKDTFDKSMKRFLASLDNHLNWYPNDGGCEEGPGYWGASAGTLIDLLEFLFDIFPDRLNTITNSSQFMNMATFIYKAHISKNCFVNFADARPYQTPSVSAIYRWGKILDNERLKSFASYFYINSHKKVALYNGLLPPFVFDYSIKEELETVKPAEVLSEYSYYPSINVMYARNSEGEADGLFLGVKGGHNKESHNHNDVGNFVVYVDGKPAIVDIGSPIYSGQSTGPNRYFFWLNQSAWHNTPTINGCMQVHGREYRAKDVMSNNSRGRKYIEMDISEAYPDSAYVDSWKRHLSLERKSVVLEDDYSLSKVLVPLEWNFMTTMDIEYVSKGKLLLKSIDERYKDEPYKLLIKFDEDLLSYVVDKKAIDDDNALYSNWKTKYMKRIRFISKYSNKIGKVKFIFSKK